MEKNKIVVMKKTKIICTIGPATNTKEKIIGLIENGMDCARFNFSHGSHESQKQMMDLVKEAREEIGAPIAILLDTKGPEIRVKDFKDGSVVLNDGQLFTLDCKDDLGDETRIGITYKELHQHLQPGTQILIDDGSIELELLEVKDEALICKVINGGKVSNHKSINVPNIALPMIYLSEKDKEDVLFGIEQGVDFIAASFVRSKEDVMDLRNFLDANGGEKIEIIAKIENTQGVDNIDSIIEVANGIMVARGDLGVEIPFKDIPAIQKNIVNKCNEKGKLVVVATQMLESMTYSPRPTRAEISDVANAVFDGAGVIMLSGETANGKYPLQAVKAMTAIAAAAENSCSIYSSNYHKMRNTFKDPLKTMCLCAYDASESLDAKAIVVVTKSARTAKHLSMFKPVIPIIGVTLSEVGQRQLALYYNTFSTKAEQKTTFESLLEHAKIKALETGIASIGDTIIVIMGSFQAKDYADTLRVCVL